MGMAGLGFQGGGGYGVAAAMHGMALPLMTGSRRRHACKLLKKEDNTHVAKWKGVYDQKSDLVRYRYGDHRSSSQ